MGAKITQVLFIMTETALPPQLVAFLQKRCAIVIATDLPSAAQMAAQPSIDLVVIDAAVEQEISSASGHAFQELQKRAPIICYDPQPTIEKAVACMNKGVRDYISSLDDPKAVWQSFETVLMNSDQFLARQTLADSEERYRLLFENLPDAVCLTDNDGKIVECNDHYAGLFGKKRHEIVGKKYSDYLQVSPEKLEQFKLLLHDYLGGKGEEQLIVEYPDTRGILRKRELFPVVVKKNGQIVGVQTISRDITERSFFEQALKESEENYRQLFDSSPEPITVIGIDGIVKDCNLAALEQTEITRDEIVGKHFSSLDMLRPANLEEYLSRFAEAILGGSHDSFETEIVDKNGAVTNMEIFASPLKKDGKIHAVQVISRDITERKIAEQALRESEERFRAIFNSARDSIFIKSCDLRYILVNQAFVDTFDLQNKRIAGLKAKDIFGDSNSVSMQKADRQVLNGETVFQEIEVLVGGNPHIFDSIKVPMRNNKNEIIGICGIARDITERKRADEERLRLEGQLLQAQKMEAIGRLAGGIAHDFNNLLTGIIGNISMAETQAGEDIRRYLLDAGNASQRAADLVRQLLTFSRKSLPTRKSVDLAKVVGEAIAILRETLDRRIELQFRTDDSVWPAQADSTQMHQVLMNLCINSHDAILEMLAGETQIDRTSGQSHRITIELANMDITQAYCNSHHEALPGQYVMLTVSDDGPGMDAKTKERIFEPFFTTKEQGRGTGLGLATVFGIVKQHEGWINLYSEPGKGTSFRIFLPRFQGETETSVAKKPVQEPLPLGSETILLIDDEEIIRNLGKAFLERSGYKVILAENGLKGLEIYAREMDRIALILLDLTMPLLSGQEVLIRIRDLNPKAKVLMSSGYSSSSQAEALMDMGAVGFVPKPYNPTDMARTIRKVLDQKK